MVSIGLTANERQKVCSSDLRAMIKRYSDDQRWISDKKDRTRNTFHGGLGLFCGVLTSEVFKDQNTFVLGAQVCGLWLTAKERTSHHKFR
jgi:hypothetical protein